MEYVGFGPFYSFRHMLTIMQRRKIRTTVLLFIKRVIFVFVVSIPTFPLEIYPGFLNAIIPCNTETDILIFIASMQSTFRYYRYCIF